MSHIHLAINRSLQRPWRACLAMGLGLALTLAVAAPSVVSAITKISEVRVAADEDGTRAGETYFANAGDRAVHVLFEYTGASRNTRIAVQIIGSSIELFRDEQRFEGDGTATVEISGDAMYSSIADSLTERAAVIRAASNQIQRATVSAGQLDNDLSTMIGSANQSTIMVPLLETIDDQSMREEIGQLDKILGRLSAVLEDTRDVPFDDVQQRQAELANASADVEELEQRAEAVSDAVAQLSDLPLPMMGPQWSYDVSVRVSEGSQQDIGAGDAFFYVVEGNETRTGSGDAGSDAGGKPTATRRPIIGEGSTARSTRTPVPTSAASGSGSGTETSGSQESGDGGTEDETEKATPLSLAARATATAAARSKVSAGREEGATAAPDEPDTAAPTPRQASEDSTEPTDAAPTPVRVSESAGASESLGGEEAGESAPPTWTPASDGSGPSGSGQDVVAEETNKGPNRLALLLGVLVLAGAGVWFRRRM